MVVYVYVRACICVYKEQTLKKKQDRIGKVCDKMVNRIVKIVCIYNVFAKGLKMTTAEAVKSVGQKISALCGNVFVGPYSRHDPRRNSPLWA